jgi:hypothetical protein
MDFLKDYLINVNDITKTKTMIVDNYKIISTNDKTLSKQFLIYDPDNLMLNSRTLIKLLMIKKLPNNMLIKLLNSNSPIIKKYTIHISEVSGILYEDKLFFDFDPYCNFLLNNNTKSKDIQEIIARTTSYNNLNQSSVYLPKDKLNENKKYDFSHIANPYGLEKVVFTGGGTKGICYIGAIIGLFAIGQIFYLNHFSGTSIGALSCLVCGCITPTASEYDIMKTLNLRTITTRCCPILTRYQEAIAFAMERFCKRDVSTFYTLPTYTLYGIWTAIDTVIKNNGLYDPQKSGFLILYALICKKVCHIMKNGLDNLIIIKKSDGSFVEFPDVELPKQSMNKINDLINPVDTEKSQNSQYDVEYKKLYLEYCGNIDFDTDSFTGWELERFFTFKEYNDITNKTLVMTGTQTKRIETVYYTHTNHHYKDLSVLLCATASMSIPLVFKAPIINDSYNLDGGIFDNYPLTHCDKKIRDKITHYNNKIFGYLIDDKNSIIDAYEILRELWLVYNGFIEIMNIGYLNEAPNFAELSEMFFEIRSEVYKLLYFTNIDLGTFLNRDKNNEIILGFSIIDLENIINSINTNSPKNYPQFELPKKGVDFIESQLKLLDSHYRNLDSIFKIGRKTDLADIFELSVKHGSAFNTLIDIIQNDLTQLEHMDLSNSVLLSYQTILTQLMRNILGYYELKGNFVKCDDIETPGIYFSEIMINLYKKLTTFETLTNLAVDTINKNKKNDTSTKNYISSSIQIGTTMISKILTKGTGNNIDTIHMENIEIDQNKSSYTKAMDYFFHTDMTGIMYKYMCIANDRICNDSFNRMRTIKINTFETSTLHFDMDDELKARLIYEGYSKTIKYFTSLLHIMEKTERPRATDEYIESFELRYKHQI